MFLLLNKGQLIGNFFEILSGKFQKLGGAPCSPSNEGPGCWATFLWCFCRINRGQTGGEFSTLPKTIISQWMTSFLISEKGFEFWFLLFSVFSYCHRETWATVTVSCCGFLIALLSKASHVLLVLFWFISFAWRAYPKKVFVYVSESEIQKEFTCYRHQTIMMPHQYFLKPSVWQEHGFLKDQGT